MRLPFCTRPVCLPVLARLVLAGKTTVPARIRKPKKAAPLPGTKIPAAAGLVTQLATAFPGRAVNVAADAAYRGPALRHLPPAVTWTCRLHANAVLYDLAPPRPPGTRGRPRRKGDRLGTPRQLAATARWTPATVRAYGRDQDIHLAGITCLWYGCLDTRTVRVILARDRTGVLALVTTDLTATPATLITRYAARWSIEQAFADARNVLGAGEARNRTRRAVERTVPFALPTSTLIITWYARHGHHKAGPPPADALSPGTTPRPNPPSKTCSPSSAVPLSQPEFPRVRAHAPPPGKQKKSWQPGTQRPHNCETRARGSGCATRM